MARKRTEKPYASFSVFFYKNHIEVEMVGGEMLNQRKIEDSLVFVGRKWAEFRQQIVQQRREASSQAKEAIVQEPAPEVQVREGLPDIVKESDDG